MIVVVIPWRLKRYAIYIDFIGVLILSIEPQELLPTRGITIRSDWFVANWLLITTYPIDIWFTSNLQMYGLLTREMKYVFVLLLIWSAQISVLGLCWLFLFATSLIEIWFYQYVIYLTCELKDVFNFFGVVFRFILADQHYRSGLYAVMEAKGAWYAMAPPKILKFYFFKKLI